LKQAAGLKPGLRVQPDIYASQCKQKYEHAEQSVRLSPATRKKQQTTYDESLKRTKQYDRI
jgi:hypothetical protein